MTVRTIPAKLFISIFTILTVIMLVSGYVWHEEHRLPVLEVYVFSLKGSQAIFVRTPDDYRILINGGPTSEIVRKVSSVLPFYSRHIDSIIATDIDSKNVSGLIDIMERYSVVRAYIPAVTLNSLDIATSSDPTYEAFFEKTTNRGVKLSTLKSGDFVIAKNQHTSGEVQKPVSIEALFPVSSEDFAYSKVSGPQIVLKISYGTSSILVMNDVSPKIQKYIASRMAMTPIDPVGTNKEVDVLVVSHSAAAMNMSHELISTVQPKYLVYSKMISAPRSAAKNSSGSSLKKKTVADPLVGILAENRFNLRYVRSIKITSNGDEVKIQKTD